MGRRLLALILCMALLAGVLTGCGKQQVQQPKDDGVMDVYASFYPIYAIAAMIADGAQNLRLNCLVQPQDGCLRDYGLSDWDLALLTGSADVLLIGGRGLEGFENLLYGLGENGPGVSALLYNLDLRSFEAGNADEASHWTGVNPHIYIKTGGAIALAERIAGSLMLLDDKNSAVYKLNLERTKDTLTALQQELAAANAHLMGRKVIVMQEALLYAAEEYGLVVEACVMRESGEAFYDQALESCINELQQKEAGVILIEKQAPEAFCRALEDAGFAIARLDVLSTRSAGEGSGAYIEALRANAVAICDAFAAGEELE